VKLHPDAGYWNRGVANVPDMTGAKHLLDCRDLIAILDAVGVNRPLPRVLDVGCGTGRAFDVSDGNYVGADIAQAMVDYCTARGRAAMVIGGPDDLPPGPFANILCISVFTHMDRKERRAYLAAFATRGAALLADIIKGDGSGSVAAWTARPEEFEQDLRDYGFAFRAPADFKWDSHVHSYYYAERV
jgi:SAM-dependent methyltransferase